MTTRKVTVFSMLILMLGSGACAQKGKGGKTEITSEMDSLSYFFGASLGQNVRQAEFEGVNPDLVLQGFVDGMDSDEALKIPMADGNEMVMAYMNRQQAVKAEKAEAKAREFMQSKANDTDYTKTESGMYYKVLQAATGTRPVASDKVRVHYEGKTIEGKVFDSSYDRGQPAEFQLNRVIPGWTEMLQLMEVGSTVEAIIPPDLAYGERGSPPNIGPNEVLIFKIELLDILK